MDRIFLYFKLACTLTFSSFRRINILTSGGKALSSPTPQTIKGKSLRGLKLTLLTCVSAIAGDAFDVISDSSGFEISGRRWMSEIVYYIDSDCPGFVLPSLHSTVREMTPVGYTYGGKSGRVGLDDRVVIYCANESIKALSYLPEGIDFDEVFSAIGSAKRYWRKSSLQILDCDIWLSSEKVNEENIAKVISHEWGHCLGLDHEDKQRSIMASTLKAIPQNSPTIDDMAGINVLYNRCENVVDNQGNYFMHKVPFKGDYFYGVIPANGIWPADVHTVGRSSC